MCGEIGSGFLSPGLTKKEKGLRLFSCIFRLFYYAWRLCFLSASSDASVFFPFTHVPETTLKPHNFVTLIPFFDPADICLHQFRFAAAPHPCDDLDIPGFSSSFPLKITEEWDIFEMKEKDFRHISFFFAAVLLSARSGYASKCSATFPLPNRSSICIRIRSPAW